MTFQKVQGRFQVTVKLVTGKSEEKIAREIKKK